MRCTFASQMKPSGAETAAPASVYPAELRATAPGSLVDAMKMETPVTAHRAGALVHRVEVGAAVATDAVIGRIG